jgi:hypothetical protein
LSQARLPILITNPHGDDEFQAAAQAALGAGASSPTALEAALRDRYPNVVVHARDLSMERTIVWYVYREGRWAPRVS